MTFETKYFGPVPAGDEYTVRFPTGLPGFEDCRRFTLLPHPEQPALVFLQSLERAELCFVTVPAAIARPGYRLAISEEDRAHVGLAPEDDAADELLVLAIVALDEASEPTANLLAPVVMNPKSRRAVQAVRPDAAYGCRETFVPGEPVCS